MPGRAKADLRSPSAPGLRSGQCPRDQGFVCTNRAPLLVKYAPKTRPVRRAWQSRADPRLHCNTSRCSVSSGALAGHMMVCQHPLCQVIAFWNPSRPTTVKAPLRHKIFESGFGRMPVPPATAAAFSSLPTSDELTGPVGSDLVKDALNCASNPCAPCGTPAFLQGFGIALRRNCQTG